MGALSVLRCERREARWPAGAAPLASLRAGLPGSPWRGLPVGMTRKPGLAAPLRSPPQREATPGAGGKAASLVPRAQAFPLADGAQPS